MRMSDLRERPTTYSLVQRSSHFLKSKGCGGWPPVASRYPHTRTRGTGNGSRGDSSNGQRAFTSLTNLGMHRDTRGNGAFSLTSGDATLPSATLVSLSASARATGSSIACNDLLGARCGLAHRSKAACSEAWHGEETREAFEEAFEEAFDEAFEEAFSMTTEATPWWSGAST